MELFNLKNMKNRKGAKFEIIRHESEYGHLGGGEGQLSHSTLPIVSLDTAAGILLRLIRGARGY